MKNVKVAIIGAGTAGLSARSEVAKATKDYVVIDDGPLGTTCARVGCMPSKVLIEVANTYHKRLLFSKYGIENGDHLSINTTSVMQHVRRLRDRFSGGVRRSMESWQEKHLIRGRARFIDSHILEIDGKDKINAESIIIAAGSSPIIPKPWLVHKNYLLTSDDIFEQESLPEKMAIVGMGVIGLELGQALSRLGVEIIGIGLGDELGGLTDPDLQKYSLSLFGDEFPIYTDGVNSLNENDGDLIITTPNDEFTVDKALVTLGRRPNLYSLGLDKLPITLNENGIPEYDPGTYKVKNTKIYIAGDVNGQRPILHEAADEGRIAGYNAVRESDHCFKRRTSLNITFSEPNIAIVGESYKTLEKRKANFVTGKASLETQGRAIVKSLNKGFIHVYADKKSGVLLGAELLAPDGEHIAHLISWCIEIGLKITDTLSLPYYHPAVEEGLRGAFRSAANQVDIEKSDLETLRCHDSLKLC